MSLVLLRLLSLWTLFLQLLLIVVCFVGDFMITTNDVRWRVAVYDTLTHGCVGFLSWIIISVVQYEKPSISTALVCALLAMAVDTDHFIAARSFALEDALNLQHRPFLHSTSTIIVLNLNIWVVVRLLHSYCSVSRFDLLPWICLVAWLSHHMRDAHRRGLWFMSLGSTPALPQWMYIGLIIIMIWLVSLMLYYRSTMNAVNVIYLGGKNINTADSHIVEL